MKLTWRWREEIWKTWKIRARFPSGQCNQFVWVTRCCKTKQRRPSTPDQMYRSTLIRCFLKHVSENAYRFGVLSDLYGLHLDREILAPYDIHPSKLSMEDVERLGQIVGQKVRGEGFNAVVFVSNSPIRSVPYFRILSCSGLEVFYLTKPSVGGSK